MNTALYFDSVTSRKIRTIIYLLSFITSKQIKLESHGQSGFLENEKKTSKCDQQGLPSCICLEVVYIRACDFFSPLLGPVNCLCGPSSCLWDPLLLLRLSQFKLPLRPPQLLWGLPQLPLRPTLRFSLHLLKQSTSTMRLLPIVQCPITNKLRFNFNETSEKQSFPMPSY